MTKRIGVTERQAALVNLMRAYATREQGGGTLWMLTWLLLFVMLAGVAIDTTNGHRVKAMLQASADSAAISGVIALPDVAAARQAAEATAEINMPSFIHGDVLDSADIEIGIWDEDTKTFSEYAPGDDVALLDAVRVNLRRSDANDNSVATTFLSFTGLTSWNVNNLATAELFIPDCINSGLVARGMVDMSSNNAFVNDICVHGQGGVDMQNHNTWQEGTVVSAPEISMIEHQGEDSNTGVTEASRKNTLDPKMVDRIERDIQALREAATSRPEWLPDYIPSSINVMNIKDKKVDFATIPAGSIVLITSPCKKGTIKTSNGNGGGNTNDNADDETIYASDGSTISNVIVVSECEINIGSGTVLENVLIATDAAATPDETVMHFGSGVQLGRDDNCAPGGGVTIWTNGSITSAAQLQVYDGSIVALGDVSIAAQAQGIEGISVQAGGNIRVTANNSFGICHGVQDRIVTTRYMRLVQ